MSLDLCFKQLHVVHINVFLSYAVYTFALVLLRHFPVLHFPVLQIPPLRLRPSFSSPANSSHPPTAVGKRVLGSNYKTRAIQIHLDAAMKHISS